MINRENITESILGLPRSAKQILALSCDLSLCLIAVVGAFYLRLDQFVPLKGPVIVAALASVLLALPVFWLIGLYRTIFRYSGLSIMFSVSIAILVYGLLYFCLFTLYRIEGVPRSIGVLQPMLLFFGIFISRLGVKFILGNNINNFKKNNLSIETLIYGAGNSGRQLAISLENSLEFKVSGFLDDDKTLHSQVLNGYNIYDPKSLNVLIEKKKIKLVLLALPSISRFKRNKILEKLRKYKLKVQTLPSVSDIIDGKITLSDIKELDVNDILNREIVPPKKDLLSKNIKNQVVLVTGAGGSIGSEICRQIIKVKPKRLILCELNEFALYNIYEELKNFNKNIEIIPIISNIQNQDKISEILKIYKVETIYHAAAYKHVPLVEYNICEGVLNNVFGTYSLIQASLMEQVSNFVLISSDKAVRPTNIMGATKRLSELCLQAMYHQKKNQKINMSIVRFGNVLESSGSVIPKFKKQIKQGGPITLTHPEVTRYFMTITEAAELVIQAGAMSKECDVFVLDMGASVKIKDLIYRIVSLSGLSIKNQSNPEGDIEVKIIGLRAGEKLYEELLLGDDPQPTDHEKIKKAQDPFIHFDNLKKDLDKLKLFSLNNKAEEVKELLEKIIDSYHSEYKIVDLIHTEINNTNHINIEKASKLNLSSNIIKIKK
ncbi:polysaccharide biosynthesis protein [Candidatus Pelagibacter sp. HIMB1593]|uniref:polysaccharide biosynthesis protein n=1 Tax=Candidatus Pelagibacter sp. HIMB1593 TaxID=3413355 RepID=UPI003F85E0BA